MISLRDVVTGFGNRDPLAEVWRRSLRGGGGGSTVITGVPPLRYIGNGRPLTDYLISGNAVQDGTPSADAPVDVTGSGVRTGNLFEIPDSSATENTRKTLVDFGTDVTYDTFTCSCVFDNLEAEGSYGAFIDYLMNDGTHQYVPLAGMLKVNDDTRVPTNVKVNGNYYNTKQNITFRKIQVYLYTTGYNKFKSGSIKWAFYGSEKKDYEPFGVKIPISSGGENLFDKDAPFSVTGKFLEEDGTIDTSSAFNITEYIECDASTDYSLSNVNVSSNTPAVCYYDSSKNYISGKKYGGNTGVSFTTPNTCKYVRFSVRTDKLNEAMLNLGSTAKPYSPYNRTTTPIYLGTVPTTRRIGKFDLSELSWTRISNGLWKTTGIPNIKYVSANTEVGDGIAEKYAIHAGAGMSTAPGYIAIDVSQVSVNTGDASETPTGMFWYVLAEPETTVVNEPLMKIGDYADTISFAQAGVTIPTVSGANVLDVPTEVKPSEITIKGGIISV